MGGLAGKGREEPLVQTLEGMLGALGGCGGQPGGVCRRVRDHPQQY